MGPDRCQGICDDATRRRVEELAAGRATEHRLVLRAQIVLARIGGESLSSISERLAVERHTAGSVWRRFLQAGIRGLEDRPRSGRPRVYQEDFRQRILATLEAPPPTGQACWDGPAVAKAVGGSVHAVWRLLRREGICLARQRSWCVSTDPQFAEKAADIVGLYLDPPQNALVISVDEKPSIQALERATGYVQTSSGKVVRGLKSTYKRHGTVNLFAALVVATGAIHAATTERKTRVDFLTFMDGVVSDLPADKEIHVILDNYCIHKKNDAWLAAHPNVFLHFTPTSASWLNMVEVWFGMLSRKALRGGSFASIADLTKAIHDYIHAYGPTAKPFVWRKREVRGSQLRNTVKNFCQ
jgi:transposase